MILLTAIPAAANPSQDPCPVHDTLEAYFRAKSPATMRVAAYDHANNTWTGWLWDQKNRRLTTIEEPSFRLPAENDPTLIVLRKGRAGIFVVNTSPLLYQAKKGAVTVQDSPAIQDLTKILSVMGGFISSGISTAAARTTTPVQVFSSAQSAPSATNRWMVTERKVLLRGVAESRTIIEPSRELDDLALAINDLGDQLAAQFKPLIDATKEVVDAAGALKAASTIVANARDVVKTQLQLLENDPSVFQRAALAY